MVDVHIRHRKVKREQTQQEPTQIQVAAERVNQFANDLERLTKAALQDIREGNGTHD